MASTPATGDLAPDFTLPGTQPDSPVRDFTLSAERGHPVVLAFYPGDETPVCTRQLCSYQHDLDVLRDLDATLWGISSQSLESHRAFQEHRGLTFPLLSDVDNTVFSAYGLGSLLNRRAVFVIDAQGRIAWSHVSTTGITYQKLDKLVEVLRGLPATASAPYPAQPEEASTPVRRRRARTSKPTA
ncbi:MAG TPA: peroxiredoxin [Mycobacteriales bacterium]|nr:peroxiredoxin [Mycobacteriales bacterium]